MRSVSEKRLLGVLVERSKASRTCEPVGERASVRIGFLELGFESTEEGKRSVLISFRRKEVLVDVGCRADCRMCVVVW